MIHIKTQEEIKVLREGGKRLCAVLDELEEKAVPGVSTLELDALTHAAMKRVCGEPALLNYKPSSAQRPYPAALCVAINDTVVHGIPTENPKILKEGDIIGLDTTMRYEGFITDSARTVGVGTIDEESQKLLDVTKTALFEGIKAAVAGNRVGAIGAAIEAYIAPFGYGIIDMLCGHGVGYKVHEDPQILNFGPATVGAVLKPGMVLAIEPMVNEGSEEIIFESDGYTVRTKDGSLSAHFEHTIAVTEGEPLILTVR